MAIDYAVAGDGVEPLTSLCAALADGSRPESLPGLVHVDQRGVVERVETLGRRDDLAAIDGIALHERAVRNHDLVEYLSRQQRFAAPLPAPYRTACVLTATGCPHACTFCQSPVEYRNDSGVVMRREPGSVADEIAWLVREHGAGTVSRWRPTSSSTTLPASTASSRAVAWRACRSPASCAPPTSSRPNVTACSRPCARRGCGSCRSASTCRTAPRGTATASSSTWRPWKKAVHLCTSRGIAVTATVIASPELSGGELARSLEPLCELPLQSVDVRLATAFETRPTTGACSGT